METSEAPPVPSTGFSSSHEPPPATPGVPATSTTPPVTQVGTPPIISQQPLPMPTAIPAPNDNSRVMTQEQLIEFADQIRHFSEITRKTIQLYKDGMDERQRRTHKAGFRGSTSADRPPGVTRPRWKPTKLQIDILEYIFENSDLLPGDKDITTIADALRLYGPVEEVNVFYWFQNRRARAKRTANSQQPSPYPPPPA